MRACLLKGQALVVGSELLIQDEQAHHLINVARITVDEKILILNGEGLSAIGQLNTINKKNLRLKIIEVKKHDHFHHIDLAIATNKKDPMEDILKMAAELGIRKIYPVRTQYSQPLNLNHERVERIFASGLEQSNNPYLPELMPEADLKSVAFSDYKTIYCFHLTGEKPSDLNPHKQDAPELIFIGPEAGFGDADIEFLKALPNIKMLTLNLPILRATTAVPVAMGLCLGRTS
ncbi:MAG: 16S rRNA (uracil(1498)-N(3))-methyltransferase [Bacteriovoracaceae bacterium]|nr:16S rRNA (uracil(1498)-N(3))-methyltransferase [Bacteriovoracaceae bacterium]